jgi:hypothetical protein
VDRPLVVAGVAEDSEQGGTAWLEGLADLPQEPLVEPEGGRFRPCGPAGGKQHRLDQQQPQHPTGCGSVGGADGCQAHWLHQLDPAVVASVGQDSPIKLTRSFAIELDAAGNACSASSRLSNPSTTSSFMPCPYPSPIRLWRSPGRLGDQRVQPATVRESS